MPLTIELLALRPDVFVTTTDSAAAPAAAATKTAPIVFILGGNPWSADSSSRSPGRAVT